MTKATLKLLGVGAGALAALSIAWLVALGASVPHGTARIFVLMVWDGLRPDLVTERDTPNLYAFSRAGVRFERHHSSYPTLTMVNAAALATGADPGVDGIVANTMFLGPSIGLKEGGGEEQALEKETRQPVALESSKLLGQLNGAAGFNGRLLGLDTVAQEVEREGGFVAVVGKQGPTFLFDDRVASNAANSMGAKPRDVLFVSDDLVEPASAAAISEAMPPMAQGALPARARDAYFTKVVVEKALPQAKEAALRGRPALVVLWQHDPDLTQHQAGLGTRPALDALKDCDVNLATIRTAIRQLGIGRTTDLMVVSDHGFATIRVRVELAEMLVKAGLKRSVDSTDVVIARNSGSDLIYLDSKGDVRMRHELLQKIVEFASAQEWCGPIFSRDASIIPLRTLGRKSVPAGIAGTFSEAAAGILAPGRSPDLIISFRELPDMDNSTLTGPEHLAFVLGEKGQQPVRNRSQALVKPVKGVVYADASKEYTTGMGMHGAAGPRELHNFCAAAGPDFRRGFTDQTPTGNVDVAPTVQWLLGLELNVGPGGLYPTGRVMREALAGGGGAPATRPFDLSTSLELQGMKVMAKLSFLRVGNRDYLDDVSVERVPLGRAP